MKYSDGITERLLSLAEEKYKTFQSSLIPNISRDSMIGVRVPALRKIAKEIKNTDEEESFLSSLPHTYYEENYLHALLLSDIKDFSECTSAIDSFLPYVDNWAVCDGLRPKCFSVRREELIAKIHEWMHSSHPYTVRFGIEMLMLHFLEGEHFSPEYLEMCSGIVSDDYYVNMMLAWFFATALAVRYESTVPYLEEKRLPPFVHNKSISKAVESYRVSEENKRCLKALKIG